MPNTLKQNDDDLFEMDDDLREAIRVGLDSANTGVLHSSESIIAWIQSWGTADELPRPKPDIFRPRSGL